MLLSFLSEMDEECFPTVSMSTACGRLSETVTVKDEPVSETDSMHSSCPPSPQSSFLHLTESMDTEVSSFIFKNKTKLYNKSSMFRYFQSQNFTLKVSFRSKKIKCVNSMKNANFRFNFLGHEN